MTRLGTLAAPSMNRWLLRPQVKSLLFVAAAGPAAALVWGAVHGTLGANPAEALIRNTGDWPLRQATGWHALARWRRTLGLYTFFYAVLHAAAYAWLDMGLQVADIVRDIAKRPFILVGATSLLLLIPLAATSWDRAVRTLGAARWKALHRTVYTIALLALLHFLWMRSSKGDVAEVGVYAAILAMLYGWRLRDHLRTRPA
jgi:sulfoxide reductase heme-binding subunit YedZ